MGTKALIGVLNDDRSVTAIRLLKDGYPGEAGRKLLQHWSNWPSIQQLLELGDLVYLGEELGEQHDIDALPRISVNEWWCSSLKRDRKYFGADSAAEVIYPTIEEFLERAKRFWAEYAYLYEGSRWYVYPLCPQPRYAVEYIVGRESSMTRTA
jgi:hypothetical protein